MKKIYRLGETNITSNGQKMTIIAYRGATNLDIQFEDGTTVVNRAYKEFKKGQIKNPNFVSKKNSNRIGETSIASNGQKMTIIAYRNSKDIDVRFEDETVVCKRSYNEFKKGKITNPNYNTKDYKTKRVGQELVAKNGQLMKIIAYRKATDIDIQFEDGTLVYHKCYDAFKKGSIANPNCCFDTKINYSRLGEENISSNGQSMKIIAYRNSKDIDIRFEDNTIVYHKSYYDFKRGYISNPNCKVLANESYNELVCKYYFERLGFKKAPCGSLKDLGLGKMELDLYNPNFHGYKVAIEYDGYGHNNKKDYRKNKLCQEADIHLIRIREPQLPELKDGLSTNFILDTGDRYSDSLLNILKDVVIYLNDKYDTCYELFINKEVDKKCVDAILAAYYNKRIGEENVSSSGQKMTIVAYRSATDLDIKFEDGTIVYKRSYHEFKHGSIANPNYLKHDNITHPNCKYRVGEINIASNGQLMEIVAYRNAVDIDVKFEDGVVIKNRTYREFQTGAIRNLNLTKQKSDYQKKCIGETSINMNNQKMTIIKYHAYNDIDIEFEDGTIVTNKTYKNFKMGRIINPNNYISVRVKIERIGETSIATNGQKMTIVNYKNKKDLDVQFEDGTIVYHKQYNNFKKGWITNPNFNPKNPINRIGETRIAKNGQKMTIIAYRKSTDIDIQFEDGTIIYCKQYSNFQIGNIKNPNFKKYAS